MCTRYSDGALVSTGAIVPVVVVERDDDLSVIWRLSEQRLSTTYHSALNKTMGAIKVLKVFCQANNGVYDTS